LPTRPLDGASFVPLLDGKPIVRKVPLYWQFDRALGPWKVALRQGPHKLLADAKLEKFALYNLVDDPREATDLAGRQPGRVRELAAVLRRMHRDVNAKKK
jgi:arylsulfatase A